MLKVLSTAVPVLNTTPISNAQLALDVVEILDAAEVKLGENYPEPIVDLKISRERALNAFKSLS